MKEVTIKPDIFPEPLGSYLKREDLSRFLQMGGTNRRSDYYCIIADDNLLEGQ